MFKIPVILSQKVANEVDVGQDKIVEFTMCFLLCQHSKIKY